VEKALAGFVVALHVSSRQRFCIQTPEDESVSLFHLKTLAKPSSTKKKKKKHQPL